MNAFKLTETKTNVLHAPQSYSLAHAVTADLSAEKGSLAWQFSLIFGQINELRKQPIVDLGNVAALEHNSRFVYYLVTKPNQHERTTLETLEAALFCLREHMRNHGIMKVAMPRLGCGNSGLKWDKVNKLIHKTFDQEFGVEILVCEHNVPLPATPKCQLIEVKGNLFAAPRNYSLAHSTSADFGMVQGLDLQFKCKFGHRDDLLKQQKHTGGVAVLCDGERFVYNLVTKERNHERCTYPALFYALLSMRQHMVQYNVTKLAIPHIGCGIDRLDWLRVKKILELVFADDDIEIIAYSYDPPRKIVVEWCGCRECPSCRGRPRMH